MRSQLVSSPVRRRSRPRSRPALRVLPALVAAVLLLALAPSAASAQGACITTLPVSVTLPDGLYAAAYTKSVHVRVNTRGLRVRNLQAFLFTFSGRRMGATKLRRVVHGAGTLTLELESSFQPMQVGGYTLVLTGEPNASRSCGPKKASRVLKFKGCREKLPVSFPNPPGGNAADYESYLSVPVRSKGPLMRDVSSTIYGFDGSLIGNATPLRALFGETTVDHALLRPLTPGRYTVVVEGLLDEQPVSCGRKRAQTTLSFK